MCFPLSCPEPHELDLYQQNTWINLCANGMLIHVYLYTYFHGYFQSAQFHAQCREDNPSPDRKVELGRVHQRVRL